MKLAMTKLIWLIVFTPKKDSRLQFCVDCRKLDAVEVEDSYPLRQMDEFIDSLGLVNMFSTLDTSLGYWQIELDRNDMDLTASVTLNSRYRNTRVLLGLKNAAVTFQRAMDTILALVKWQHALVYIDVVFIISKSPKEHLHHVESVLQLIQKAGMTLKLKNCIFF